MDQIVRGILLDSLKAMENNEIGLIRSEEKAKSELERIESELKTLREKIRAVNIELRRVWNSN
jgi:hypothetical protein